MEKLKLEFAYLSFNLCYTMFSFLKKMYFFFILEIYYLKLHRAIYHIFF